MALFAGSVIVVGLRRLSGMTVEDLDRVLKPWSHAGLALLLITGPLMLFADWSRYRHNPAVGVKLGLVAVGLIVQFTARGGRFAAIATVILWTAVVLASRAIADFDI